MADGDVHWLEERFM